MSRRSGFNRELHPPVMRFANFMSIVIGLVGLAIIVATLFILLPGMGGGGFLWLLIALLLLGFAAMNVVPASGLVLPWVLRRFAPRHRWLIFAAWFSAALPILVVDATILWGHKGAAVTTPT